MRAGGLTLAIAALALAGCADTGAGDRPRPKPEQLNVRVSAKGTGDMRAQVLTRSGELRVTEYDGSQKLLALNAPSSRRLLHEGQGRLEARTAAAGSDEAGTEPVNSNGPALSPKRIADFEAHALPALPVFDKDTKPTAEDFKGATVTPVAGDKSGNLVEVAANLRQGVDDDVAFAYATCALAGWAVGQKAGFARHIRSVDRERNGTMTKSSVFTISKTRPLGLMVVDVKETLRECKSRGIPAA